MKKSFFALDALGNQEFEGLDTTEHWNGWAVPFFTFEQAQQIVAAWRSAGWEASYSERIDAFVFGACNEEHDGEEHESFGAFERDGTKLYVVGSYVWTWEKVENAVAA